MVGWLSFSGLRYNAMCFVENHFSGKQPIGFPQIVKGPRAQNRTQNTIKICKCYEQHSPLCGVWMGALHRGGGQYGAAQQTTPKADGRSEEKTAVKVTQGLSLGNKWMIAPLTWKGV